MSADSIEPAWHAFFERLVRNGVVEDVRAPEHEEQEAVSAMDAYLPVMPRAQDEANSPLLVPQTREWSQGFVDGYVHTEYWRGRCAELEAALAEKDHQLAALHTQLMHLARLDVVTPAPVVPVEVHCFPPRALTGTKPQIGLRTA